jgi:hypothetical protein
MIIKLKNYQGLNTSAIITNRATKEYIFSVVSGIDSVDLRGKSEFGACNIQLKNDISLAYPATLQNK